MKKLCNVGNLDDQNKNTYISFSKGKKNSAFSKKLWDFFFFLLFFVVVFKHVLNKTIHFNQLFMPSCLILYSHFLKFCSDLYVLMENDRQQNDILLRNQKGTIRMESYLFVTLIIEQDNYVSQDDYLSFPDGKKQGEQEGKALGKQVTWPQLHSSS